MCRPMCPARPPRKELAVTASIAAVYRHLRRIASLDACPVPFFLTWGPQLSSMLI